jgi:hypothetical protein
MVPGSAQREDNDAGHLEYLRIAAPAAALLCVAILYHSAATASWSRMVAEWLRDVAAAGVVPLPFGAYFVADGWLGRRRATAAAHWPCVNGTVISSSVRQSYSSPARCYYVPVASYRYTVADRAFEGHAIQSVGTAYSSETEAKAIAGRYAAGAEVAVRYDPQRPWIAMLDLGNRAARRRMLIGAACLAAPFIFATLAAWHNSYF